MEEDYWKRIIENVKVDNFDYNRIKLNLNNLKEKNPKYYMKVDKDLKSTFCINLTSEKKKELCLQFYLKCIYKKIN